MKTVTQKLLSALCCAAILCACTGCASVSADPIVRTADEEKCRPAEQTTCEIKGTPLSSEQLSEFTLDFSRAESYVDSYDAGEFLDALNDPQLKMAYCKALALVWLLSTENIEPAPSVDPKNRALASVTYEGEVFPKTYMESGYTYDSFMTAYRGVFSESLLEAMLSRTRVFYDYGGELWYLGTSAGGNAGEVRREYELISKTDSEVRFRRVMFSVPLGAEITDYDPEKRGEYIQTSVDFCFTLTGEGWKAAEFLNQQNSEGEVYFS